MFKLKYLTHSILIVKVDIITMEKVIIIGILVFLAHALPPQNPIIGIYTEDAEDFGQPQQENQTYISASYIKNI